MSSVLISFILALTCMRPSRIVPETNDGQWQTQMSALHAASPGSQSKSESISYSQLLQAAVVDKIVGRDFLPLNVRKDDIQILCDGLVLWFQQVSKISVPSGARMLTWSLWKDGTFVGPISLSAQTLHTAIQTLFKMAEAAAVKVGPVFQYSSEFSHVGRRRFLADVW